MDWVKTLSRTLIAAVAALAGPAAAQTAVRFSLDSRYEGPTAPFLVALDRGYFKAEGLEVSISASAGLAEPVTRVASGLYDMSVGDINALIRFRDGNQAAPLKAVFMVYDRPPFAVIGRRSRQIAVPKDLEGKTLGAPAADPAFAQWPVFARANAIDPAKVAVETVGFAVREPMLAAGQVDAITGLSFASFVNLKERGVPLGDIVMMLMADYGVELYGDAVIVNPAFVAEKPEAVKGFLRALTRGLKDTAKNPAAAIESVLKRSDGAKKDVELERLAMALRDNIVTPAVKASGLGGVDMERLDRAIDQIAAARGFARDKPKAADIFDDSFLPPAAERAVN